MCCRRGAEAADPLSSFASPAPTYLKDLSLSSLGSETQFYFPARAKPVPVECKVLISKSEGIDSFTKNLSSGFPPTTVLLVTLWGICILCTSGKSGDETRNWKVWN